MVLATICKELQTRNFQMSTNRTDKFRYILAMGYYIVIRMKEIYLYVTRINLMYVVKPDMNKCILHNAFI